LEELKRLERDTGVKAKNFEGKEIYENLQSSGFDYKEFEKQIKGMEWEVRQSSKEIQ